MTTKVVVGVFVVLSFTCKRRFSVLGEFSLGTKGQQAWSDDDFIATAKQSRANGACNTLISTFIRAWLWGFHVLCSDMGWFSFVSFLFFPPFFSVFYDQWRG
jgi:ABC-type spermidine/putrescine transport system permease subunit II